MEELRSELQDYQKVCDCWDVDRWHAANLGDEAGFDLGSAKYRAAREHYERLQHEAAAVQQCLGECCLLSTAAQPVSPGLHPYCQASRHCRRQQSKPAAPACPLLRPQMPSARDAPSPCPRAPLACRR